MNREELLALQDAQAVEVKIGERVFHVRAISAGEMVDFDAAIKGAGSDVKKLLAIQLSTFMGDASGNKLLSVEDAEQVLNRMRASVATKIVEAGMKLNALNNGAQEALSGN